ncbi:MAG: hypothetical protein KGQ66_18080 [Acidobacteriota bacterium]|nr:hypothetical protein [Acidobacteriota bacterium]
MSDLGRRRMFVVVVAVAVAFSVIGLRLADVQVFAASRYNTYSRRQDTRITPLPGLRGSLLDRNGRPLAISEEHPTVIADPLLIAHPGHEASVLAPLLHLPVSQLAGQLHLHDGYVVLAGRTTSAAATEIRKLSLPGLTIETNPSRTYPAGQLAAPLIGSVNAAGKGVSGLELAYDHTLTGRPGRIEQEVDPRGQPVPGGTLAYQAPQLGDDVELTIDEPLQYQAEQALGQALVTSHAKSGMALVMDTHTGALLAVADLAMPTAGSHQSPALPVGITAQGKIVSSPTAAQTPQPVQAPTASAFTEVYEPGSVEKLVTVSAALSTGAIQPEQTFTVPNAYDVAGTFLHDAENHGTESLSVTGILAQSSNIGAIQIVQRLGAPALYRYLASYGIGSVTPVDFPGESAGLIPSQSGLGPVTLATMGYGEGMAVTAAQMVAAYNTVANGGVYVAPQLVSAVIGPHGHRHSVALPAAHRVVPSEVASEMTGMLEQVVSAGTGTAAAVTPYAVAGKTGTAQYRGATGYVAGRTVSSFAGYAPAQNPAVTVLVVVDDTPDYGAQAAAPAFSVIMRDALEELGVAPGGPQPSASPSARPLSVASGPSPAQARTTSAPGFAAARTRATSAPGLSPAQARTTAAVLTGCRTFRRPAPPANGWERGAARSPPARCQPRRCVMRRQRCARLA